MPGKFDRKGSCMSDPVVDFIRGEDLGILGDHLDLFNGDIHLASYWASRRDPDVSFVPCPDRLVQMIFAY